MSDYMGDYLGDAAPAEDMGGFFDFLKKKSTSTSHQSMPVLSKGSQGMEVRQVQELLDIGVDGVFGSGTENAVKSFQISEGIPSTGVVNAETWAALLNEKYVDPEAQADKQAQTAQTINQISEAASGIFSQFFTPPANQQELLSQPVAPPAESSGFPWMWVLGGLAGVVVVGGVIYVVTRGD